MSAQTPRPNPDSLVTAVRTAEREAGRGRLKVFFGAAPGVGKTYAMLEEARRRRADGADVVVGVVETHGRDETAALLDGLEIVPRRRSIYRGVNLEEFDVEGALRRRPELVLIDELAHTNAPDSWHAKRWQDVEEVLSAGIDVYTTLNVQHLESVNDLVAKITGVIVRETVPDAVFDNSQDVELVDLTSDDLLGRLREGKVYIPTQAARAVEGFFTKGNLIALRELALRRMADRIEAQAESFRRSQGVAGAVPLSDRFIVAVSPSPFAQRVVRAARRLAERFHAEWEVVYIERPAAPVSTGDKDRVLQTLRLAQQLGARTMTLSAEDPAAELVRYAKERNSTRIIVGKPGRPRWRDRVLGTFVDSLIQNDAGIDVYVVRGEAEELVRFRTGSTRARPNWLGYLVAAAAMAVSTLVAWPVGRIFHESSVAMLYVLGTVIVALALGRGPSILASILGVLCYDFFFVPPFFTFAVGDARHFFTFLTILVVGNVIATLALQTQRQAQVARRHERRARSLYQFTRDLSSVSTKPALVEVIQSGLTAVISRPTRITTPGADGTLVIEASPGGVGDPARMRSIAEWVMQHGRPAGQGTDTFPTADHLYIPLHTGRECVGVCLVLAPEASLARDQEQMLVLDVFARQAAHALEQLELVRQADEARMEAEAERLQNTLLSAVSHDLRTPLATIAGAASTLVETDDRLLPESRLELARAIHDESGRLERLVTNLLNLTRLEAGALKPLCDWQSVEELVGIVLGRMEPLLAGRPLTTHIELNLPLLNVDPILIEQALLNLLDNAVKHTGAHTAIDVAARRDGDEVVITVSDRGAGLPKGAERMVFDRFVRGPSAGTLAGAGLGLTIVRGFVEAHNGRVTAYNAPEGGATFEIRLPVAEQPTGPVLDEVPNDTKMDS